MTDHMVVGREEWEAAHNELLQREKEQTRVGDELARQRRELPWVAIEKEYQFDTDNGPRTLAELFDGRSQLLIYHFMFGPSYEAGCPTCSSMADGMNGLLPHLHARDLTLAFVSRAPIERLQAYKQRMRWSIPWVSSANTDFSFDLGASFTVEQTRENMPPSEGPTADRASERGRDRDRCPRIHLGNTGGQRLQARGRRRLPDLCDHVARGRVPDGLLPDPRPGAKGAR
jgi:predicted dithiol-disulfide oxidoreductase (DUF899 family)